MGFPRQDDWSGVPFPHQMLGHLGALDVREAVRVDDVFVDAHAPVAAAPV